MDPALREAQKVAEAVGESFIIGVRPHGNGWFANCRGVEWDGSTAAQAVKSVADDLARKLKTEAAEHEYQMREKSRAWTDLVG